MIATDERTRLERLIALTPPGARREQYSRELQALDAPVFIVADPETSTPADRAQWDATLDAAITQARAERAALAARWNKGYDYLAAMEARGESETAEFERLFAVWLDVDERYKAAEDRLAYLELTREMRRGE